MPVFRVTKLGPNTTVHSRTFDQSFISLKRFKGMEYRCHWSVMPSMDTPDPVLGSFSSRRKVRVNPRSGSPFTDRTMY